MKLTVGSLLGLVLAAVILGILVLFGVSKAREYAGQAKAKDLARDFQVIPTLLTGYQAKFKAVPGDDRDATTHVGAEASNGDGDSVIAGMWNACDPAAEPLRFWQHVRMAQLASGETRLPKGEAECNAFLPHNALGGKIGIASYLPGMNDQIAKMTGRYQVCSDSIPGAIVLELDRAIDDGDPSSGKLRAVYMGTSRGSPGTPASQVSPDGSYLACMVF